MFKKSARSKFQRSVPIRQLAEFAADPKDFAKNRGKIRNKKAVQAGNSGEFALGRVGIKLGPIVAFAVAALVVLWLSR